MPTINANGRLTGVLLKGSVLTLTISGAAIVRLRVPGSGTQKSALSASGSFGPFVQDVEYVVDCTSGTVTTSDAASMAPIGSNTTVVSASRRITPADNGQTLEVTADGITLTFDTDLPANFGCAVLPTGTTSFASANGVLLNGATTTLTRAAASNSAVAIIPKASASNSYVVTGS